jgi:hypothetical protein
MCKVTMGINHYVKTFIGIYTYEFMYIYMYICMYVYIYIYIYISFYIILCIYIYINIYICIYIRTSIFIRFLVGNIDLHPPVKANGDFYWSYHKYQKTKITWELFQKSLINLRKFNLILITEWLDSSASMIDNVLGWSFFIFLWVECFGYLLLGCSVISVSVIICMLTLLLMPLAGLHFCVGLDLIVIFFK